MKNKHLSYDERLEIESGPSLTVSNQKDYLDIEKSSFFIILYLRMSS